MKCRLTIGSRVWEVLLVGALLAVVLCILFARPLLSGDVLSSADAVLDTQFFSDVAPEDFEHPSNPLLFDQVYQFTPWRHYVWQSLREGQLPLWNPHSLCGSPLVATLQSAVFYPINLILLAFPFPVAFLLSAFLRLWIAGLATYALVRMYRLAVVPAFIAAVSFMLCGFLIVWLGHPHTNVAIWLPALILLAELLLTARTSRAITRSWVALSLVVGVQFTGGAHRNISRSPVRLGPLLRRAMVATHSSSPTKMAQEAVAHLSSPRSSRCGLRSGRPAATPFH